LAACAPPLYDKIFHILSGSESESGSALALAAGTRRQIVAGTKLRLPFNSATKSLTGFQQLPNPYSRPPFPLHLIQFAQCKSKSTKKKKRGRGK